MSVRSWGTVHAGLGDGGTLAAFSSAFETFSFSSSFFFSALGAFSLGAAFSFFGVDEPPPTELQSKFGSVQSVTFGGGAGGAGAAASDLASRASFFAASAFALSAAFAASAFCFAASSAAFFSARAFSAAAFSAAFFSASAFRAASLSSAAGAGGGGGGAGGGAGLPMESQSKSAAVQSVVCLARSIDVAGAPIRASGAALASYRPAEPAIIAAASADTTLTEASDWRSTTDDRAGNMPHRVGSGCVVKALRLEDASIIVMMVNLMVDSRAGPRSSYKADGAPRNSVHASSTSRSRRRHHDRCRRAPPFPGR